MALLLSGRRKTNSDLLQDAEMMEQIDRDVMRTHPDMHFFSGSDGSAVTHREARNSINMAIHFTSMQKAS